MPELLNKRQFFMQTELFLSLHAFLLMKGDCVTTEPAPRDSILTTNKYMYWHGDTLIAVLVIFKWSHTCNL